MKHNLHAIREGTMKVVFLLTACISILAVALICIFLFANGIPTMHKIGLGKFLFGMTWAPNQNLYGIFPMIIASILVTGGAILIGVPLGLLCALYLARFCPKRLYAVLNPAVDLLAGIRSIVYGFFGLVVLVPALQAMFGSGKSIVTASIMLGIMILPTIISVSESSLRAVPESYYEGSLALGATHERSVFSAVFPAARLRHPRGHHPRCRPRHRRDHGRRDDRGQPAHPAQEPAKRRAHPDGQYRAGDGLCHGPAPRGPHRLRRGAVRVHPDHQSVLLRRETKG